MFDIEVWKFVLNICKIYFHTNVKSKQLLKTAYYIPLSKNILSNSLLCNENDNYLSVTNSVY